MTNKTYIFKTKGGNDYKVRFYSSGCYTIFDKNGEHEVGEWKKTIMGYEGRGFSENISHFSFKMEELAYWLLRVFMHYEERGRRG